MSSLGHSFSPLCRGAFGKFHQDPPAAVSGLNVILALVPGAVQEPVVPTAALFCHPVGLEGAPSKATETTTLEQLTIVGSVVFQFQFGREN